MMSTTQPRPGRYFDRAVVGAMHVDLCSEQDLVELMLDTVREGSTGQCGVMVDVNGHGLALAVVDKNYRDSLVAADVVHADGEPIVWASRMLCAASIPERTGTTDLVHAVGRASSPDTLRVYFLGAKAPVVARAAERFVGLYPQADLVGFRDGYFSDSELDAIAAQVNASGANIVFLGLGKPREQRVALDLAPRLHARWIITCGGCLDFLAGDAPRAPQWMQRFGLEWLYRMANDPKRLAWRYLWTNVTASLLLVLRTKRRLIARQAG